jgi:hypothetical protein
VCNMVMQLNTTENEWGYIAKISKFTGRISLVKFKSTEK